MHPNRSMPPCAVIPELAYPDVAAAIAWLAEVFEFRPRLLIGQHRAQLEIDQGALIVMQRLTDPGPDEQRIGDVTHSVLVRIADVDAHYGRAVARGAIILHPLTDYPCGERQYTVRDPGGHVWTFSQSVADVSPESWGGTWASSGERTFEV
jgi:uncharacterized glyoxalase superfamily protein PhnB